jgi:hypothetical protein
MSQAKAEKRRGPDFIPLETIYAAHVNATIESLQAAQKLIQTALRQCDDSKAWLASNDGDATHDTTLLWRTIIELHEAVERPWMLVPHQLRTAREQERRAESDALSATAQRKRIA